MEKGSKVSLREYIEYYLKENRKINRRLFVEINENLQFILEKYRPSDNKDWEWEFEAHINGLCYIPTYSRTDSYNGSILGITLEEVLKEISYFIRVQCDGNEEGYIMN